MGNEVGAADAAQRGSDAGAALRVVPEEECALCLLGFRVGGAVNAFTGVGVIARVVDFGAEGHRGRREVLNLFEVHVEAARGRGELRHVGFAAARMA